MTVSVRQGGSWHSTIDPSVNMGGSWKQVNGIYARQGGVWQPGWERVYPPFYPNLIPYSVYFTSTYGYFYRTPSAQGNRQKFSLAAWIKRAQSIDNIYGDHGSMACTDNDDTQEAFGFTIYSYGAPYVYSRYNNAINFNSQNNSPPRVFVDIGQWYHWLLTVDLTIYNGIKLYINGLPFDLDWVDIPRDGDLSGWNGIREHRIGGYYRKAFKGHMACHLHADGIILTPEDIGEFINPNTYVHKPYTGAFGTNGWLLEFADPNDLGKDTSGNDNHFARYGVDAYYEQCQDTPTNCIPWLNSYNRPSSLADDSGHFFASSASNVRGISVVWAIPSKGRWFVEWEAQTAYQDRDSFLVGVCTAAHIENDLVHGPEAWLYYTADGQKFNNGVGAAYGSPGRYPAKIAVVFNANTGELEFCIDGVSQGVAFTLPTDQTYFFFIGDDSETLANYIYCRWDDPAYPIEGAKTLCTANLPEPPLRDHTEMAYIKQYIGDSVIPRVFSGLKIDCTDRAIVWIRRYGSPGYDYVFDSPRGAGKFIRLNTDEAEGTDMDTVSVLSSDGFTINDDSIGGFNYNNNKYALRVLAMLPKFGMDMGHRSGDGQAGRAVSHNLPKAPEIILTKNLTTGSTNWRVGCALAAETNPWNHYLELNTDVVPQASSGAWHNTPPTASVFTVGDALEVNAGGNDYVDYLFTSVSGLIKIGWYDGERDLEPIHMGFQTALFLVKNITVGAPFLIYDRSMDPHNPRRYAWRLNYTGNPSTGYGSVQFYSDRIAIDSTHSYLNAAGSRYIYMAISAAALQFANAG